MSKTRPVNLDIKTIRLPITAIASILHRISAVIIWVGLGMALAAGYFSLQSNDNFDAVFGFITENFIGQFIVWGLLTAFGYYIVATLKHIIQDFGHFEELESGLMIARVAIGLGILLSIFSGVWVWL
ncbi:succinate dehydrogenase, cytochrome b556 subunit [Marinomonas sp. THO17]|uniref:succinate dehydrogenase, cytochrome b556 subunit n=1 Tax=Marinomonas sp. THO17 TaxID=3149048 RepID=UPI00336BF6A1